MLHQRSASSGTSLFSCASLRGIGYISRQATTLHRASLVIRMGPYQEQGSAVQDLLFVLCSGKCLQRTTFCRCAMHQWSIIQSCPIMHGIMADCSTMQRSGCCSSVDLDRLRGKLWCLSYRLLMTPS
jgi:hypothetical protein